MPFVKLTGFAMLFAICGFCVLLVAGCADDPVNPAKLRLPSWRLMEDPEPLPPIPDSEGNPQVRAQYYGELRGQCVAQAEQLRGLQRYARSVTRQ